MQQKHRRFRRDGVDLLKRGQAFFSELIRSETADHAHPLRRWRAIDLRLQHRHCIGQRAHAIPAQLQVVIQTTTDQVRVAVVEAGQQTSPLRIDGARALCQGHDLRIVADCHDAPIGNGDGSSVGLARIERGDARIANDEIDH